MNISRLGCMKSFLQAGLMRTQPHTRQKCLQALFIESQDFARVSAVCQSIDQNHHFAITEVVHEIESRRADVEQFYSIAELVFGLQTSNGLGAETVVL